MAHIKTKDINPDIRLAGMIARPLLARMNEKSFRRAQRLMNKFMKGHLPNNMNVEQRYIDRPDGSKLRLLVVLPKAPKPSATGVLWLHGGGYALGVPEMDLHYARKIQAVTNSVVVMPDYRLSIEAPYPAALSDAYLALKWFKNNASN